MTPRRPLLALVAALGLAAAPVPAHEEPSVEIEEVTEQIARDPGDATLYLLRAEEHLSLRHWSEAAADFRRARTLEPASAVAALGLGRALAGACESRAALRAIDQAPSGPYFLIARADAKTQVQETSESNNHRAVAILVP